MDLPVPLDWESNVQSEVLIGGAIQDGGCVFAELPICLMKIEERRGIQYGLIVVLRLKLSL